MKIYFQIRYTQVVFIGSLGIGVARR